MSEMSVQLYTVREALEQDLDGTLARIAGFGFTQVEPFALLRRPIARWTGPKRSDRTHHTRPPAG